ncbi:hypothetical protein IGB42_00371 [Andreprevotia sp. IGB-42]|uniref:phage late control D family protein n=1 Tax=Andreprevotia sp. IGB-42 TaxID=2497473 RepID=UPI00135881C3|nr:phage late control D family protein [Andreprevotia sp. IGB-42]KAF0815290.1 hypothetical protein IGB42_00371 [Andreprevotia sp. IGB-42]
MNLPSTFLGRTAVEQIGLPVLFLHVALFLPGRRIISDETFRLISFSGQESVSSPFEYTLELHGASTAAPNGIALQFADVIGSSVTVGIQYPCDQTSAAMADRFRSAVRGGKAVDGLALFNGIVTSFSSDIPGVYRISMKPALYRLTLTNAYQVYPQINISDLIGKLMKKHQIDYSVEGISSGAQGGNQAISRVQDWLQAGESDFSLLQRLLGKASIYFYITHSATGHKVVFANQPDYVPVYADGRTLRYTHTGEDELGLVEADTVTKYTYQQSLTSSNVLSTFTRQEEAWDVDPIPVFHSYAAGSGTPGTLPFNQYRIYQYGCSHQEVADAVALTGLSLQTSASSLSGSSHCAFFRVGAQFALSGADTLPAPMQPMLDGQPFVLTEVKHEASADGGYNNDFQAAEAAGLITPFSIENTQQGTVLAQVVAHASANNPSDWRYYAPDNFDPESSALVDTLAQPDTLQAKGVYVRFSTADPQSAPVWIKLSSSMQTVPELGVTVIVARAQDESELPEIQNIVHANGNMVVTPSGWTADTRVGSSYSTNYGDSKSIRFGRSSTPQLQTAIDIVSNAYTTGQFRDASYSQGASYSFSTSDTRQEGLLNQAYSYGSSRNFSWAAFNRSFSAVGVSYNESVIGRYDPASQQPGSYPQAAAAVQANITTLYGDSYGKTTNNGAVSNDSYTSGATTNTTVNDGKVTNTNTNNADVVSTNTVNGNSTSINKTSGNTKSDNTTGTAENTSMTGAQVSNTLLGASTSQSMTGATNDMSITGASNRVSITGVGVDTSISGSSTRISIVGNNNVIDIAGPGFRLAEEAERPVVEMADVNITIVALAQIYL